MLKFAVLGSMLMAATQFAAASYDSADGGYSDDQAIESFEADTYGGNPWGDTSAQECKCLPRNEVKLGTTTTKEECKNAASGFTGFNWNASTKECLGCTVCRGRS